MWLSGLGIAIGMVLYKVLTGDTTENENKKQVVARLEPCKQIAFVGATDVGKSSTINALIGSNMLSIGCEHGTTTDIASIAFSAGYMLVDTPGLYDMPDYSSVVWDAIKCSRIVIYTVKGQLYQREIEFIDRIHHYQRAHAPQCKLVLYVNKRDIAKKSATKAMYEREIELIRQQVSQWISPMHVVAGFAHSYNNSDDVISDVHELRVLIGNLMF